MEGWLQDWLTYTHDNESLNWGISRDGHEVKDSKISSR